MTKDEKVSSKSKIKIFVGYYKPNSIYKSDIYQPILTSSIDWNEPSLIRDNTGINIAEKNKNYAELTGHYWVWKNFLHTTDSEYIGFCHYRRFLDFNLTSNSKVAFKTIQGEQFKSIFKKYTEQNIINIVEGYDVILPQKFIFDKSVEYQYNLYHPTKELQLAMEIIKDMYPEYYPSAIETMQETEICTCLNFVMKKELLNEYFEWIFSILTTLEQQSDWTIYEDYNNIRVPAYIAERFFNIWLLHNTKTRNLKVLNTSSYLLVGKGYCNQELQKIYANIDSIQRKIWELRG